VRVDLLKGKTQTPETLKQPLNEVIDVKGMRAQGNRLSFHTVKNVKLMTQEVDLTKKPEQQTDKNILADIDSLEKGTTEEALIQASDDQKDAVDKSEETVAEQDNSSDDISLEITNPDDINLDDSGQTSLF